jgi:hypothetical protein
MDMSDTDTAGSPRSNAAKSPYEALNGWPDDEKTRELERYGAHAALLTQANAFLNHNTTTAGLYFTVTGAAWTVVSANAIRASNDVLLSLLVLHIALSICVALGMWGVANNLSSASTWRVG